MSRHQSIPSLGCLFALLLLPGCGGDEAEVQEVAVTVEAPTPGGLKPWHADFPGAPKVPHLSPRAQGRYEFSRRAAMERLADKLQGNCTRDAWLFAKDLFDRTDFEDAEVLIETLDRALQIPSAADHVENLVEAMGRVSDPRMADALLRAMSYPRESVQSKVMEALRTSGDAATVREAWEMFASLDRIGQTEWLEAARLQLPPEELIERFRAILADPRWRGVRELVFAEASKLPPEVGVEVFRPWIGREPPGAKGTIAGMRHAIGDKGGSAMLRDMLGSDDQGEKGDALTALVGQDPGELLDDVLALSVDESPTIRGSVLMVIGPLDGEHIDRAIESLSDDPSNGVRRAAVRMLVKRGHPEVLRDYFDAVQEGTGTRLRLALEELVAAQYGGAVPVMVERMQGAPDDEKMEFLRAIALSSTSESFAPLREAFLSAAPWAERERGLIAYLMANCRGAENGVIALFGELAKDDYVRRGLLMDTLAKIAGDRSDPHLRDVIYGLLRGVLADQEEIPQMRLAALQLLRRDLDIEDRLTVQRMMRREQPMMAAVLNDFLWEFY